MINPLAPIFFAGVVEYLAAEMLEISANYATDQKRVRITVRDLELSIHSDPDISVLCHNLNICFLGGGRIPYIHSNLITERKRNFKRANPGVIANKMMKKYQKLSKCLTFSKGPFETLVRDIVADIDKPLKIEKHVFLILQYFIEQYIMDLLSNANFMAIHAGRTKVCFRDIEMVLFLQEKDHNPYIEDDGIDLEKEHNIIDLDEHEFSEFVF